jgi:crotonobetainyl-CoA:carnitine CoA-transferase CaiB-like acyl-CoA transferase
MMAPGILDGVRVLDLTQNVAGPFCTQILADFGASIVKIERPGTGDDTRAWTPVTAGGESATFLALNRGKESVGVDISRPEGVALVARLAARSDVIVHSVRPASIERMGLGYETLAAANPGLVYCAISAFGECGPLRDLPGYDPLMQAFSGIMSVTGNEGDEPVRVSVSLVDMGTGMWAAMGILAALLRRSATGTGGKVETSLLDTSLGWMTTFVANYFATGRTPQKLGSAVVMTAPYQVFRTQDGHVFIGAGNDRLFARTCEALGRPDLVTDPRFASNAGRVAARGELQKEIEAATRLSSTRDIVAALRKAGAPCSELNSLPSALASEQTAASEMIGALPTPASPEHKVVRLPVRLDGARPMAETPPPALGDATQVVLAEMGVSESEIHALETAGILSQPKRVESV